MQVIRFICKLSAGKSSFQDLERPWDCDQIQLVLNQLPCFLPSIKIDLSGRLDRVWTIVNERFGFIISIIKLCSL